MRVRVEPEFNKGRSELCTRTWAGPASTAELVACRPILHPTCASAEALAAGTQDACLSDPNEAVVPGHLLLLGTSSAPAYLPACAENAVSSVRFSP